MIPEDVKLEPCPFCGGDAKLVDATQILGSWKVIHRCKVVGYLCVETFDRERAISDWNARLPRQDEIRKAALEEAAKVAEGFGEPYALHTNTGAMMFRACTEKIATAIRALSQKGEADG